MYGMMWTLKLLFKILSGKNNKYDGSFPFPNGSHSVYSTLILSKNNLCEMTRN